MNTKKKSSSMSDESLAFLEELTGKKVTLGSFLWAIRESDDMTQVVLAKKLDISRQYLCDVEHGRRFVSPKMAAEFAIKLGYSRAHFIRLALQDELNRDDLPFFVQLVAQKNSSIHTE